MRSRLNAAFAAWDNAWQAAEDRLAADENWQKLSPEQKHQFRQEAGLLPVTKPAVDTPHSIADALSARGLTEWDSMTKALTARIDEALSQAALVFEPKIQTVRLQGATLRTKTELELWLDRIREQIVAALPDGPVIPRV